MNRSLRSCCLWSLVLCSFPGCWDELEPWPYVDASKDAGIDVDSGFSADAGVRLDGGISSDGSLPDHGGSSPEDAGSSIQDAGAGESDGGLSAPDGGNVDAGGLGDGGFFGDDAGSTGDDGGPTPNADGGGNPASDGGTGGSGIDGGVGTEPNCGASEHAEGGACVPNQRECSLNNGVGQEVWEADGWGACELVSCNAEHHEDGGACIANTRSCQIANGSGVQTWNEGSWGTCIRTTCNSGNHDGGNGTCVTMGTCASGYELNGDGACVSSAGGYLTGPVNMQFAVIPKGTFTMGSPSGELGRQSDETQHAVTFTYDFAMGVTEVTQGQWKAKSGGMNPSSITGCGDNCPVERVDWYSTLGYANALSEAAGLEKCYTLTGCNDTADGWQDGQHSGCTDATFVGLDCTGYRLPTEAEWEYAYRAGTTTAYYSGVNSVAYTCDFDANLDAIGWYCGNASNTTHAVGGKQANAWGLYDMSGNVWEWTWDWYGTYPGATSDYVGPQTDPGNYRVLRGGSWNGYAVSARAALRSGIYPDNRNLSGGFRLTRTLP